MYFDDLIARCTELLQLDLSELSNLVEETVSQLVLEPTVKCFEVQGRRSIALIRYYKVEKSVAYKLLDLNASAKRILIDADSLIAQFERLNRIEFHPSRRGQSSRR